MSHAQGHTRYRVFELWEDEYDAKNIESDGAALYDVPRYQLTQTLSKQARDLSFSALHISAGISTD